MRTISPCLLVLALLSACTGEPQLPLNERTVTSEHEGYGVVIRILENSRLIQVRHGDIPDFMPAMTMPFEYRADSIREVIAEGDSIRFNVATDGIDNWITSVSVIN